MEATRAIKRELPRTIALVLTVLDDADHLSEALKAGAAGYVLKSAPVTEIIDAARKVLAGGSPLNQEVATRLLMRLVEGLPKVEGTQEEEENSLPGSLSPRETEVLRLTAQGCTNRQIARDLLISVSPVKKHLRSRWGQWHWLWRRSPGLRGTRPPSGRCDLAVT